MVSERKRTPITLYLDDEVRERLTMEAEARDIPRMRLMQALIAEGLDRLIPVDEWKMTRG